MAHEHDTGYRLLFSAPEMVRDLLRGYVPQEWVESADFASLRRVNASYVSETLRRRDDDMVWKIRLGEQWLYVYLLLEFQSVPDRWMALRMQVYAGLLYQDLVARKELGVDGKLPPVLPIVLYNGAAPWRWADSLEALLSASPPGLAPYRAQARYLLVDERRLAAGAGPLGNLAGALFRLEAASELEEFQAVTKQLVAWLAGEEQERLRRAFAVWLSRRLRHRLPEANIPETEDLAEVHGMFPDNIIATAEKRGEAAALMRLLTHRFGELAPDIRVRIEQAELTTIIAWFERAIDAPDLDAVFRAD